MTEIIIALLALIGTAVGSITGVLAANKLTNFRIEQLEKKTEKQGAMMERMTIVECDLQTAFEKIEELEEEIKHGTKHYH